MGSKKNFSRTIPVVVLCALTGVGLLLVQPITARANVMTFENLSGPFYENTTYIEDGIKMTLVSGHYDLGSGPANEFKNAGFNNTNFVWIDGEHVSQGIYPYPSYPDKSIIKFEMADGSNFDLNSIYLISSLSHIYDGNWNNYPLGFYAGAFEFSNGSTFIPIQGQGNTMFNFSGYTNLSWFTYSTVSSNYMMGSGLDQINMTVVPEPSTMLLLGSGLAGLLGYGRMRRKK